METTLSIQKLAEAANLSRWQIDQWISRGHFKPEHTPEAGKARTFTIEDALILGTLAELVRLGITPTVGSMHVNHVYTFADDMALLVITQSPMGLAPPKGDEKPAQFHHPQNFATHSQVVRSRDLLKIATDPQVRSMAVVNISEVEKRVLSVAEHN